MARPDPTPRWVRSALFIPAQRDDFLAKAASRRADAVILDWQAPAAGTYYLIAAADSDAVVAESAETNNIKYRSVAITAP